MASLHNTAIIFIFLIVQQFRVIDAQFTCQSVVIIPDTVTEIPQYAFFGCSSLTSVTIPSTVMSIGDYAFQGCSSLTSVTIPSSVTSIGYQVFQGCNKLSSLNVLSTSVTSAFGCSSSAVTNSTACFAFMNCDAFTSLSIPSGVTSIGDNAFGSCNSLTSVTIPSTVRSIGSWAFYFCWNRPFEKYAMSPKQLNMYNCYYQIQGSKGSPFEKDCIGVITVG